MIGGRTSTFQRALGPGASPIPFLARIRSGSGGINLLDPAAMKSHGRPPLFILLFFSIFGFIGIAVIAFLWGSGNGFGSPPLFFKVFGSLIALGFIAMGFGFPLSMLRRGKTVEDPTARGLPSQPPPPGPPANLVCPACGANVGKAEVSPSGDVKCSYCHGWWNIHRR
jgi:hypothetical protein